MSAALKQPTHIMQHFYHEHLPPDLREVSRTISEVAMELDQSIYDCAEKTAGLRKLLEAKDCFVRAQLEARAT